MESEITELFSNIPVNKHHSDFSLSIFAAHSGYKLISIKMQRFTKEYGEESGFPPIETIEATITLCRLSDGLLSYLKVLPKYQIPKEMIASCPSECDDIQIRFSIRLDGQGYYTPTWITCWNKDPCFTPNGDRIDWDYLENKASKWTHRRSRRWNIPDSDFEKATSSHEGSVEAAKKMLDVWFDSGAYRLNDTIY